MIAAIAIASDLPLHDREWGFPVAHAVSGLGQRVSELRAHARITKGARGMV
jgi:hypothetical protein